MPISLDQSYAACTRVARAARSSFYPCFRMLPREKRQGMIALYAFMRYTDDLADDETINIERRREKVDAWEQLLQQALSDRLHTELIKREPKLAILPAVADTVRHFEIPSKYLTDVLDGVRRDLTLQHYQTFEQTAEYCHLVASAVGLACIRIWGANDYDEVVEPARACGLAFQMINILRDIGEDLDRGRIYLPLDDIEQTGYSIDELKNRTVNDSFRKLVALEAKRARAELKKTHPLTTMLHPDGRLILGMMTDVYRRLLDRVEKSTDRLLSKHVQLGRLEKMFLALRWSIPFLRPKHRS